MKKIIPLLLVLAAPLLLHAATGDVIRTIAAPSPCVTGVAAAGDYLWVVDRKTDLIYKIDHTGTVLKTLTAPGYFCSGIAWDGEALWVADIDFTNTSTESYSGKIYQIDPETGRTLRSLVAPFSDPQGLTWQDGYLWVADNGRRELIKISVEDGTTIQALKAPSGDPRGLAWDGSYLWVADRSRDEIYRVCPETGDVILIMKTPGPYPWGLTWMGKTLMLSDYETDTLTELVVSDGTPCVRSGKRMSEIEVYQDFMNFGPGTVDNLDVYIAEPENRETQKILSIDFPEKPKAMRTDRWGQKAAWFSYKNLGPGDRVKSVMRVKAELYDVTWHIFPEKVGGLDEIPADIKRRFLRDDEKYSLTDPVIQSAVKEAVGDTKNPYFIARNIFDYLRQKLYYERSGGWDIAPTVLKRGNGSCSEYTFVYIAMCRAAGLPARYVGSVVVRGEDACVDYVYHRWVEVYLPGCGWIPVDPSGGDQESPRDQAMYFGHLANRFLITTQGGGGSEYMGWDYNVYETHQNDGPVQVRIETMAEWDRGDQ